jgi:hypothetical protein
MELAGGRQMAFYVWKCDPVTGRIRVLGENFTLFEVTIILDAFPRDKPGSCSSRRLADFRQDQWRGGVELDGENCALIGAAPFAKSRFALGRLHLI